MPRSPAAPQLLLLLGADPCRMWALPAAGHDSLRPALRDLGSVPNLARSMLTGYPARAGRPPTGGHRRLARRGKAPAREGRCGRPGLEKTAPMAPVKNERKRTLEGASLAH